MDSLARREDQTTTIIPGPRGWLWTVSGAIGLLLAMLAVLYYHREENAAAQLASKHRRIELVDRMRLDLSTSSEAEKSAVMAITDRESQAFAEQARTASSSVEQERQDLDRLLTADGDRREKDLLAQFSRAFAQCQSSDRELLGLAVRNTNLKAYSLTFGPAAESIGAMDQALTHLISESVSSTSLEARHVMWLAARAQSGALRIQAMLPAHISEESDQKMDSMEARMA